MTTQQMLDERYGRAPSARARRLRLVLAALGVAAGVAITAWFAFSGGTNTVEATTTGFDLADEGGVVVSFQVGAPAGTPIACALEAQDEEHGIVGWRIVEYPGSAELSRAFREVIPVTAEATTGFVNTCWVP